MRIVISFLICLALTDGATISNVEPVIMDCIDQKDHRCVGIKTDDVVISKVEDETDVTTATKYCPEIIVFGFILDILSVILATLIPNAVLKLFFNAFLLGIHTYAYALNPTGSPMANLMVNWFCNV